MNAMKESYPELESEYKRISATAIAEEEAFLRTLTSGSLVLDQAIADVKKAKAASLHGDALKVLIAAPALDDKANTALLAWLGTALNLPRTVLKIRSGATSRRKVVEIQPADAAIAARAARLAEE
jgi:uncharacterized protein YggU (UPF0235/DUF167 family)